jgi:hypothetical protein
MAFIAGPILLFVLIAGIGVAYLGTRLVLNVLSPKPRVPDLDEALCPVCRYDLRGTISAGGVNCPECGAPLET